MMKLIYRTTLLACILTISLQQTKAQNEAETKKLQQYLNNNRRSPEQYIIDKFKSHDVILLSEDHAIKHNLLLAQDIIPLLYKAGVYNFGVEFGAFEDQALADSLISAPQYNEDVARKIMFNYNVGWVYQEYRDIYEAAWQLNRSLPAGARKFRIVNISYRYNWAGCDEKYFGHRNSESIRRVYPKGNMEYFRAGVIKQVMDKGEKILVLCGFGHAYTKYNVPYYDYHEKEYYRFDTQRMGNILYKEAPKKVFTILLHYPFESKAHGSAILYQPAGGAIDRVMKNFTDKRVGFDLANTPFGQLRDTSQYSIGYPNFTLGVMADGYIYQKPFNEYEGCTIDKNFLTDENWPAVKRNYPDKDVDRLPESKEAYLENRSRYADLKLRYRNLQEN